MQNSNSPKTIPIRNTGLSEQDTALLLRNAEILENPGIAVRLSKLIGIPIEKAMTSLPANCSEIMAKITQTALDKAIDGALLTIDPRASDTPANTGHKILAGLSGAVGGSFGVAALAIELPVSTTIMLRSIADIARSEGENLQTLQTKMACLEVFALSGGNPAAEGSETAYYAVRSFLSRSMSDTAQHIAKNGLIGDGAPVLVNLINAVASRFHVPVSQKFAAQSVPAIGAIGGASVNLVFISHFQEMARAHFGIRKLERIYGPEIVRDTYQKSVNG